MKSRAYLIIDNILVVGEADASSEANYDPVRTIHNSFMMHKDIGILELLGHVVNPLVETLVPFFEVDWAL